MTAFGLRLFILEIIELMLNSLNFQVYLLNFLGICFDVLDIEKIINNNNVFLIVSDRRASI